MTMPPRFSAEHAVVLGAYLLAACSGGEPATEGDAERGWELFESGALSDSAANIYRCSTCHEAYPSGGARVYPGAPLAGVTERPSFWGGQENDLLRSLDACRNYFMYASGPLRAESAEARALYAFLSSLAPGSSEAVPFSVVVNIAPLPRGDAERGSPLFVNACGSCHGTLHEGQGALPRVPPLPDATLADHAEYTPFEQRLVFIEKVRHGGFLGYGGAMPPFSTEVLSDEQLSDILEALGVFGE
jgi:thiosulfate dehydrogenase